MSEKSQKYNAQHVWKTRNNAMSDELRNNIAGKKPIHLLKHADALLSHATFNIKSKCFSVHWISLLLYPFSPFSLIFVSNSSGIFRFLCFCAVHDIDCLYNMSTRTYQVVKTIFLIIVTRSHTHTHEKRGESSLHKRRRKMLLNQFWFWLERCTRI